MEEVETNLLHGSILENYTINGKVPFGIFYLWSIDSSKDSNFNITYLMRYSGALRRDISLNIERWSKDDSGRWVLEYFDLGKVRDILLKGFAY
jgi:hypothetical protein